MKFLILNGPNLNLLGIREPDIYGRQDYAALERFITGACRAEGIECRIVQSNHEGVLVDHIQEAYGVFDGIVINPAAYTHTSIAILDALKSVGLPTVEVHISNISKREKFRRFSFVSLYAEKVITGHGAEGYCEAIGYLCKINNPKGGAVCSKNSGNT